MKEKENLPISQHQSLNLYLHMCNVHIEENLHVNKSPRKRNDGVDNNKYYKWWKRKAT
jgi:hypothetical protein